MPDVFWDGEKYREFRGAPERPGPQRQVARAVRPGLGSSGLERYLAEVRRNGFWQTAQREVSLGNLDFGLGDSLYGASFGLRYTHTARDHSPANPLSQQSLRLGHPAGRHQQGIGRRDSGRDGGGTLPTGW